MTRGRISVSKKTKLSLLVVAMFAFTVFVALKDKYVVSADASSTSVKHLTGYAWSSNIGWISFSAGGANPLYEVTYDPNDFSLSGYAWSSNVGWISFGCGKPDTGVSPRKLCSTDLTGAAPNYPSGGEVTRSGPRVNSDNKLVGFARACSVFMSGCSGPIRQEFDLGGWDGWISLSGMTSEAPPNSYGVSLIEQKTKLLGYAWGGGELASQVPGWISFRSAQGVAPAYGVTIEDTPIAGTVVSCERSSFPIVNIPITWTANVSPAGNYNYHWNIGKVINTDYEIVGGSVDSSSVVIKYKTEGPQTTDVNVTTADGSSTVVGSCSPVTIASFNVSPLGFVINHQGDMNAGYVQGRGITTFTFPNVPISVNSIGEYTSPVMLVFKRIENSNGVTVGSANSGSVPTPALIVNPQFTNSTQSIPSSTITLNSSNGVYDSATLRLVLTKNQDDAARDLSLPSGDYKVIIDSSTGGHEHSITLHLSNPTGGVRER